MPHQPYAFINKMVAVFLLFAIVLTFWDWVWIALRMPPTPVRADREGTNDVLLSILMKSLFGLSRWVMSYFSTDASF